MKFAFICDLCSKEVKRGDKFQVELSQWVDTSSLTGDHYEKICKTCADRLAKKINGLIKY